MKKFFFLLLTVLLIAVASTAFALDVKPGDTITMNISITESDGTGAARISISTNGAPVSFVTATAASGGNTVQQPMNLSGRFSIINGNGIVTGPVGTVVLKINADAAPGTYTVSPSGSLAAKGVSGSVTFTVVADVCTHTYESTVTKEATCDAAGVKTFTCSACGDSYTEEIPALGHKWDAGRVTSKPTCSAEGVKTFTCKNDGCGKTKTEKIAKNPTAHTPDENAVTVKPTCTTDGYTTGVCKDCGKDLNKVVVPATGHQWDEGKTTTEATCDAAGVKTFTCQNEGCGETKTEPIAALGHKWDEGTVTTKATCSAEGVKTFTCQNKDCGKTKTEPIAKDPTAHTPDENSVTVKPTCTTDGYTTGVCKDCGKELNKVVVPATGHKWDEGKTTTEATCEKAGVKTFTCQNEGCGETKTEPIAALDHKYDEKIIAEATCKTEGVKTFTCSVCGNSRAEKIPALGHKEETIAGKAATCTENGLTDGKKCTVCGEVTLKQEVIVAKGHTPGEWVVVKAATQKEDGLKEQHCSVCDALLATEVIPMVSVIHYPNNTACSMGPAFRDETGLTKKWYRFTPIDLSVEGTQSIDLLASNMYIIGKVFVTVSDGTVTVDCDYVSHDINVKSEFCTFLPSLAETVTVDQAKLTNYAFGEAINIADDLAGDTKVLLYICNVVDYNSDLPIVRIYPNSQVFKRETEALKQLMD